MIHKMGLAIINRSAAKTVENPRYYLSTDANYKWTHATTNVYSSVSFTSKINIPLNNSNILYYIVKSGTASTTISSSNDYASADNNGNSWSKTYENIDESTYVEWTPAVGMTYASQTAYTIAIGDVLYSDGALTHYVSSSGTSLYSDRTAIGIVFFVGRGHSGDPAAWTHGYALGLREFNYTAWSNIDRTVNSSYLTTYDALIADMAGYSKTLAITQASGYSSTTFPAAYRAWNYSAKSKNGASDVALSGNLSTIGAHWFLPSCGQWYKILYNLGNVKDRVPTGSSGKQWIWSAGVTSPTTSNNSSTARDGINKYITPIINAGYATSNVSPINTNINSEAIAVRKIPFVSRLEGTTYDNTYKTSSETGASTISVILFGAAPDLCITLNRTGDGYSKSPSTHRDSMRPVIGF